MPPRDWRIRIEDIIDAAGRIARYVHGKDLAAFESDDLVLDAERLIDYGERRNVDDTRVAGGGEEDAVRVEAQLERVAHPDAPPVAASVCV